MKDQETCEICGEEFNPQISIYDDTCDECAEREYGDV